jgi:DNA uptake protein ComE-like DNA-binding protein
MIVYSNYPMIRSLTIKFVMLAGLLGCIMALGWSDPDHDIETKLMPEPASVLRTHAVTSTTVTHDSQVESPTKKPLSSLERGQSANLNSRHPNTGAIDLNFSTGQELETLPGIGPTLATRIIEHRTRIGGFSSIDALVEVKGIGTKKLQALSPLVEITPYVVAQKP